MPTPGPLTTEPRPLAWFRPDPRELARHDDPDAVRRLGEDMRAHGQLQPVAALEDGTMVFGHGRLLAARAAGMPALTVAVYPATLTETQVRLIRVAENVHRTDLTPYQRWIACADLLCGNPTWRLADLAGHLHLDPSTVTRLMSPSKCTPAWQEALKAGTVGLSDVYAASKLPAAEQDRLLDLKLAGANRDCLERAGEIRAARPAAPAVRLARVRCPVPAGRTVVVTGPDMTLADVIDALAAAVEAARRAQKESLDVRTAEKVWRDKAKTT